MERDIFRRAAHGLKPPPRLTVSQWADRDRQLSPEASAEPGRWSTDRAPYQRGIMDAVNDPAVETVVIMSSAQVGKTEIINNVIGYLIDQDACPILVIMPTLEMAEAWSKDRLAPMLRDTPALRGKVKDARAKATANTLLHKVFPGGHITMAGANSPASLSSRPVRCVFCDEVDRYPVSAGAEGDPINLAFKRATTFWNRKRIITSTPTIKGASRVETAYGQSDQRQFFVPCLRCGQMQVLQWANVRWPEKKPEAAYYECTECHAPLHDADKPEMLRRGVWVPQRPGGSVAGFHINELYSPWVRWSEMAAAFVEAKRLPETLKTWINTSLGETWEEEGESVEGGSLYERREEYHLVPDEAAILTAGVDVQDDRIEMEVVAWGKDFECWSMEYLTFRGSPAQPEIWAELDAALLKRYEHESGVQLPIAAAFVDSGGHFAPQVYRFCRPRVSRWVYALKGEAGPGKPITRRPTRQSSGAQLFHVAVDVAKELIYSHLRVETYGPGFCHFPRSSSHDPEYFKQLTAEKQTTRFHHGFPTKIWVKTRPRNEALDCRVYALAAFDARKVNIDACLETLRREATKRLPAEPVAEPVSSPAQPSPRPTPRQRVVPRKNWMNSWR